MVDAAWVFFQGPELIEQLSEYTTSIMSLLYTVSTIEMLRWILDLSGLVVA